MKKLLLPVLFLLMMIPAMSQGFLVVSGTVQALGTGLPIPNHEVVIHNDSNSAGYFYETVYTNSNGFYNDTIPVVFGGTTGNLYVGTVDCQNYLNMQYFVYTPAQNVFTADFSICNSANPCQAAFTAIPDSNIANNTYNFIDQSTGNIVSWLWNFGDPTSGSNNVSTIQNPTHIFSVPGLYNVCLTIQGSDTTCNDMTCQTLVIGSSGGCVAAFTYSADSNNLVQFSDLSSASSTIISWAWDFGDPGSGLNNSSSIQNPTHIYSQPGTYTACLTIHGSDSSCFDMTCMTVTVGGGVGCQAAFVIYPDSNAINTYHFIPQCTGVISTYTWSFGDGTGQTITFPQNPNVTHTYASAGIYLVCLTIQGANNCYDITCDTLVVGFNTGCVANFSHSVSPTTSSPVQFVDLSQASGGLPIISWFWDFGDGGTSTLQNPLHLYASNGTYSVCLTIQGADSSCFDMTCKSVVVGDSTGCQANFTYSSNPAQGNHTVAFTDLSIGNPSVWSWSFGDGTSGNVQNPVHTYASPGTYYVCLTISGNNCQSVFCQNVIIQDSTNYHQVYGQVFAGNFPITTGLVMIFSLDTIGNYNPYVAVSLLDSNGVYYFTMVPDGSYYILAMPFDSNGYLPTYYGNTISWQQATLITLGNANNPYNINLVPSDQMTAGPGSTSGSINMGDVSNAMLDKINMIIMNEQSSPIGFTKVSTTGTFIFPSLAYGTYYLHPEMPGVTSDIVKVVLTPETPHAEVVMTFTGNKILGLQDEKSLVNQWSVYPNPVTDHVTIALDLKQDVLAVAEICNLSGQVMLSQPITLENGNNINSFSTSGLPAGIFILRIFSNDGINIHTKLVKTR